MSVPKPPATHNVCPACGALVVWQDYSGRTRGASCERNPPHYLPIAEAYRLLRQMAQRAREQVAAGRGSDAVEEVRS
jgi:hypothetical protein